MSKFFSRLFSAHPVLLLVALPLTVAAVRWLWLAPGASERAARGAAEVLSQQAVPAIITGVTTWGDKTLAPPLKTIADAAAGMPPMARDLISTQAADFRRDLFPLAYETLGVMYQRSGEVLRFGAETRDKTLAEVAGIRSDLSPVLASATKLGDAYAALPDKIGKTLAPAWTSIEPEITCRRTDSFGIERGYGDCLHARVSALAGEWAKAGGVFVQRFPQMADSATAAGVSVAGLLDDARQWTAKYVRPRPMTKREKVVAALKIALGIGIAGLRGGAF